MVPLLTSIFARLSAWQSALDISVDTVLTHFNQFTVRYVLVYMTCIFFYCDSGG